MSDRIRRRLTTIVAADIAGFSRLVGIDEEATIAAQRSHSTELIEPLLNEYHGRIANTAGDSFLLEFPSAVEAVRFSTAVQSGLAKRNRDIPSARRIEYRIGINVGDVVTDGEDLLGDGVNIAARLESLCEPGGIVLSDDAYRQVRDRLDIQWRNGGEHEVKNITRPVQVWRWHDGSEKHITQSGDAPLSLPEKPSIALLPFDNMSEDKEQEYFSDGISEDLTTALSRFDTLFVIARNSAFTYKGKSVDVKRVGQELGVRYVLEGSVRRAGKRVRINAQLVDAQADRHVWAERFDRQMDDVFELQDDIVASIAATVGPEITLAEIERIRSKRPDDLAAWDYYLRAIACYHKMTQEDVTVAVDLLNKAIDTESDFANAYALLGLCHAHIGMYGWIRPARRAFDEARHLTDKAVRLAPSSPESHHARSFVLRITGETEQAITAARRALDLNPNYADAYSALGHALIFFGKIEEGLAACHLAKRSNPRDTRGSLLNDALGHGYFILGEYEQAIEVSKQGLHQDPSLFGAIVTLAGSYAFLGHGAEAKHYIDELLHLIPRFSLSSVRKNPMFVRSDHVEKLIEGMRLAGLPE